jgi:MFS family permease
LVPAEQKAITVEEAIQKAGGMGKFQIFAFFFGIYTFTTTGYVNYNLSYLELLPNKTADQKAYNCFYQDDPEKAVPCVNKDICHWPEGMVGWDVNWDEPDALHNWAAVDKLNLYCTDDYLVGLIGSMFFFGWMCSLLVIPRLADKFGRKWFVRGGLMLQTVCFFMFFFTKDLTVVLVGMFMVGLSVAGKSTVEYIYICEFLPKNRRAFYASLLFMIDGCTLIVCSI